MSTVAPAGQAIPQGWFPDPTGRHQARFWDGAAWTDVSGASAETPEVSNSEQPAPGSPRGSAKHSPRHCLGPVQRFGRLGEPAATHLHLGEMDERNRLARAGSTCR